jgi:DNA-binding response OmpR family regulator
MPTPNIPKKEKILIIEGDVSFGEQIVSALKAAGYANSKLIKNGDEGLQNIFDDLPHLILLDITLSDTDGYAVLAKKQAEPLLAKIPVFLMSTQGVPINMRSVPSGSVVEFLMALHIEPKDIVLKINEHFGYDTAPVFTGETTAVATGPRKKILWVEDDKLIGTILAKKLVASGFDLTHANNGEEALNSLNTMKPDAIVVDLLLPGMSGFDILQKIHDDVKMKGMPTMVLSNLSKPSDIEKARVLGARKFLVKAATSLDQIVAEVKELSK